MQIHQSTPATDLLDAMGWDLASAYERANFETAFNYFVAKVPLDVLNEEVRASAWIPFSCPLPGPTEQSRAAFAQRANPHEATPHRRIREAEPVKATKIMTWLQAIDFTSRVDPDYCLHPGDIVKRFRKPNHQQFEGGKWYTTPDGKLEELALPKGLYSPDYYVVNTSFRCLRTKASDVLITWIRTHDANRYSKGGGTQLFIYSKFACPRCLSPATRG